MLPSPLAPSPPQEVTTNLSFSWPLFSLTLPCTCFPECVSPVLWCAIVNLLKQIAGSRARLPDSHRSAVKAQTCITNYPSGHADAVGPGTTISLAIGCLAFAHLHMEVHSMHSLVTCLLFLCPNFVFEINFVDRVPNGSFISSLYSIPFPIKSISLWEKRKRNRKQLA